MAKRVRPERLVKCQDNGVSIPVSRAFKAPNGKYYSSEEVFASMIEKTQWRNKCIDAISQIVLGNGEIVPPVAMRFIQEYPDFKTLYKTITGEEEAIRYAIDTKSFATEFTKYKYIFAIIGNSYNKYVDKNKKVKEITDNVVVENIELAGSKSTNSKSVADLLGDD